MAGQDDEILGEDEEPLFHGVSQVVRSGLLQIRSPQRSGQEGVPGQHMTIREQADAPGGVARSVEYPEIQALSQWDHLSVLKESVRLG